MLHIYGQAFWHQPVLIAGTLDDILQLGNELIFASISNGYRRVTSFYQTDGEGYPVVIQIMPDEEMQKLPNAYNDEVCGTWNAEQQAKIAEVFGNYTKEWQESAREDDQRKRGLEKLTKAMPIDPGDDPAALKKEIERLKACLKAYEKAEHKVLHVDIVDSKFPPSIVFTAPNMDEQRIAEYCIGFYNLFFECAKVVIERNTQMPSQAEVMAEAQTICNQRKEETSAPASNS